MYVEVLYLSVTPVASAPCISIYLSIYLSIDGSIYLSISISIYIYIPFIHIHIRIHIDVYGGCLPVGYACGVGPTRASDRVEFVEEQETWRAGGSACEHLAHLSLGGADVFVE